jgi:hypothetical protein
MNLAYLIATALLSYVVGGVLLVSALAKLRSPKAFLLVVMEYRVLPLSLVRPFAWIVPPTELLCALLLLSGSLVSLAAGLAVLLFLSFIVAISINIVRGRELDCNCFGAARRRRGGWQALIEDVALLGFAVAVLTLTIGGRRLFESWSPLRVIVEPLVAMVPTWWAQGSIILVTIGVCLAAFVGLIETLRRSMITSRTKPRISRASMRAQGLDTPLTGQSSTERMEAEIEGGRR